MSVAFQTDKAVGDYGRLAALAEGLGFDGVSTFHDLGFQPSLPALLEMAAATSRVRLGVAALNPSTLHPVEIAGQAAALAQASGGRSYVGLVRGAWLDRVGAPAGSLVRLREAVEVVQRLLAGDDSGWEGEVFRLEPGLRMSYAPMHVPLLLGTWSPRGLALAAAVADEVKLGGCANPAMVRHARERLDAAGGADVGLVAGAVTVVDEDGTAARALGRREVAMYLDVVAALDPTAGVGDDVLVPLRAALAAGDDPSQFVPDDVLRLFAFAGRPAEIAAQCAELAAAGATRIEFGTPHGRPPEHGLELLGREVLPALRELA